MNITKTKETIYNIKLDALEAGELLEELAIATHPLNKERLTEEMTTRIEDLCTKLSELLGVAYA